MLLRIYIAHTGEQLHADPVSFASPDALRSWISRNTAIPTQRQILMTARGKNVRLQTLATEDEIYLYDRQYVSDHRVDELPELPFPEPFNPEEPPDRLADKNNLQAWRDLYMARRSWALNFASGCSSTDKSIDQHLERTAVIQRATGVALENLKSHVTSLNNKFREAQTWANELLKEQQSVRDGWQSALQNLEAIPATKDFTFLQRPSTPKRAKGPATGTLQDYADLDQVKRAGSQVSGISKQFSKRMDEVEKAVRGIGKDTQGLTETSLSSSPEKQSNNLEEVESLAKRISADYEQVLRMPDTSKSLSSVSRMALNHTEDLLPSMMDMGLEMHNDLERAIRQRNQAMRASVRHMQNISAIESRLASVQAEIADLDVDGDAFEVLDQVFHLPLIYGSILIESVRRQEWSEKMKTDSLSLAEELAVFRDEEQRRRKKWAKNMGDFLTLIDDNTPSVEVNLQGGHGSEWPDVTRKEAESYIEELRAKPGLEEAVQDLTQLFKDLDAPTKQQKKKAKAFKQGSVLEMGRSSFLMRGDDMIRSLRDEKTKLEDKLKGSESRIRKLEDLLHRQSQMVRPLSGNFGSDVPMSPASPRPDTLSRRSSVSSRRMSSNHPLEDKALTQRVVSLEAELMAEKETVSRLQQEARSERQSNTDKLQEAQSTKQDLMDNFETHQREFEEERKYLVSEVKKYKIKLEETEEEFDRLADRHDNEKRDTEERIKGLESELNDLRESSRRDAIKFDDQLRTQRLGNDELYSKNKTLQSQVEQFERRERDNVIIMKTAHLQLSPGSAPPEDLIKLSRAIETLAEGLNIHTSNSENTANRLGDENTALRKQLMQAKEETEELKLKFEAEEAERSRLQELLNEETSKLQAVRSEIEDERKELETLRSKYSAGETGSEALKERLQEEERKVTMLSEKLAVAGTRAQQCEDELQSSRRRTESLEEAKKQATSRFDSRGARATEVSQKLYSHIENLGKVLEQLGFSIVRQDTTMAIQRASKVNNSSILAEGGMVSPNVVPAIENPDQSLWAETNDSEDEQTRYTAFITAVNKFDIEVFSEAIVKRVKDIETLARKWQKDARGYREKYHRMQIEAHDKIAYRSFKEGDLALFLPTRNPAIRSWAAFNVGAPHYFLREQDVHKLQTRDWLLARISKVEERVVDLSKSMNGSNNDRRSIGETSEGASIDDDNPFELSDGLRWYLLDAAEEKPGAPSTPGLGKSTVASAHVDAKGSIRLKRASHGGGATTTLTKSLDSRRNSSTSKKGLPAPPLQQGESSGGDNSVLPADGDRDSQPRREEAPIFDEVRRDLLSDSSNRE